MRSRTCLLLWLLALPHPPAAWAGEDQRCPKPVATCVIERRLADRNRGSLGFELSRCGPGDAAPPQARYVVRSVFAGQPAAAAGIKAGDFLLAMDGQELSALPWQAFEKRLEALTAGERITLRIWRAGKELVVPITALRPADAVREAWVRQHVLYHHTEPEYHEYLRLLRARQRERGRPPAGE